MGRGLGKMARWMVMLVVLAFSAFYLLFLRPKRKRAHPVVCAHSHPCLTDKQTGPLDMRIFFGSQTGTAQDFAWQLMTRATKEHFKVEMYDLEDFEPHLILDGTVSVFIVSTYGEGDPTDNAQEFVTWLENEVAQKHDLSSCRFVVFGLGNSVYERYNTVGKNVFYLLSEGGASALMDWALWDDDEGIESEFIEWGEEFVKMMSQVKRFSSTKSARKTFS